MTTVVNPKRRPAARKRTSRRRNDENPRRRRRRNEDNPRRRRPAYHRRRRHNDGNPRIRGYYRRRPRQNPSMDIGRAISATGGGLGVRLLMRQIAGLRGADGKLTTMHYLTAAGAVYFAPDLAGLATADQRLQQSAADGAAAVAGNMAADEYMPDFSAKYLLPFKSPAPITTSSSLAPAAGVTGIGDRKDYAALMGAMGQVGSFVTQPDGSVVWYPSGGTAGDLGAGDEVLKLPEGARLGTILRSKSTGQRYQLRQDASGAATLFPLAGEGMGDRASYKRLL